MCGHKVCADHVEDYLLLIILPLDDEVCADATYRRPASKDVVSWRW